MRLEAAGGMQASSPLKKQSELTPYRGMHVEWTLYKSFGFATERKGIA